MGRSPQARVAHARHDSAKSELTTATLVAGIAIVSAAAIWWWHASSQRPTADTLHDDLRHLLWTSARSQLWADALQLVNSRGATAFHGLLKLTMVARSMASLHGDESLSGICCGECAAEDAADPTFERWLSWLASQRFEGWAEDARDALFVAVRSRDLRTLQILTDTLSSERATMAVVLRNEPLLQLATTTRAEVTALCRILLLSDRSHARRRRLLGWLRRVSLDSHAFVQACAGLMLLGVLAQCA